MKKLRNHAATVMGVLTSVAIVFEEKIDFPSLDYHNPGTYLKLAFVAIPAIGGWFSELKPMGKKKEDAAKV